jgi:hypothetical protein
MSIERLKEIAAKGERWPKGAELEVLIALPKLLAVVEAISKLGLECDYEDVLLGYSACGNCKVCVVNARMAEL